MSRFRATLLGLVTGLCISAPPAAAQTASPQGYSTPAGQVQSDVDSGTGGLRAAPRRASGEGSHLPFTGLDVGLLGGVGFGLVLIGEGLSRLTRAGSPDRRP